ncbi:MAG: hypothetical protein QM757_09475 [Paludibaculum sp.]
MELHQRLEAGRRRRGVDLRRPGCRVDSTRVVLTWIRRAAEGALQTSSDGIAWKTIQPLPAGTGPSASIELAQPVQARYVEVQLTRTATPDGYLLSEFEVFGTGGLLPQPKPAPSLRADGRLDLAGGAWRVQRDSLVQSGGQDLSQPRCCSDSIVFPY